MPLFLGMARKARRRAVRSGQRIMRVVVIEWQHFAPAVCRVARLALRAEPAAMHILPRVARRASLRRFAKPHHPGMAGGAFRPRMPTRQAIGGLSLVVERHQIKLRQRMPVPLMFDMAFAAGSRSRLWCEPVKPGVAGPILRNALVAGQALDWLGGAFEREVAGTAAGFELRVPM